MRKALFEKSKRLHVAYFAPIGETQKTDNEVELAENEKHLLAVRRAL